MNDKTNTTNFKNYIQFSAVSIAWARTLIFKMVDRKYWEWTSWVWLTYIIFLHIGTVFRALYKKNLRINKPTTFIGFSHSRHVSLRNPWIVKCSSSQPQNTLKRFPPYESVITITSNNRPNKCMYLSIASTLLFLETKGDLQTSSFTFSAATPIIK